MKKAIALGLVALSLGACNKSLLSGPTGSPQRKAGLWEQLVQTDRGWSTSSEACFDAASDQRFPVLARQPRRAGACAKFNTARSADGYVTDSDCSFRGASGPRVTNHEVVTGDFSSKYTLVNTLNIQNAPNPARNGSHTITFTATYKGACPADIPPGQIKLASGQVVDMAQVRRGWGGVPVGMAKQGGNGRGLGGGQGGGAGANGWAGGNQGGGAGRWNAGSQGDGNGWAGGQGAGARGNRWNRNGAGGGASGPAAGGAEPPPYDDSGQ
jgi:hypothetical protein